MLLIRNPRKETQYHGKWNPKDHYSWNDHLISQVPHGINPLEIREDGLFFIELPFFVDCFERFSVAHYRKDEGYRNSWYDVIGDDQEMKYRPFYFTVPENDGDIYLDV